jgi:predicted nucleic-acid-binding protein
MLELTLQRPKQERVDCLDYLIGAIANQASCQQIGTFDQNLRRKKGFRCLL